MSTAPGSLVRRLDELVDRHPHADPAEAAAMLRRLVGALGPQVRATARDLRGAADHLDRRDGPLDRAVARHVRRAADRLDRR